MSTAAPPALSELIRDYQARTGDSQHRLSRRSADSGRQVTQRYIGDIVNGQAKSWPSNPQTFEAIATAIETTPLAIVLGYAVELGVPVSMPSFASRLPPRVDELDERVQQSILALLWSLTSDAPVRRFLPADEVPDADAVDGADVVEGPQRTSATEHGQQ